MSWLENIEILPWTSAGAYATLRQQSEAKGITCGSLDLLIAAHAVATHRTLVTNDKALHRLSTWLAVVDWVS
jgi:tRNA(fMet)-specific endonuclease VapC